MRNDLTSIALASALAACTSTSTPDHTTMTGTNAFAVASTVMVPKGLHCSTDGALPSGKLDALTVVVSDVDLQTTACGDGDFDILQHVLQLQVATGGYFAADPASANQPISPGTTFPILNENVADENLCGNVPAGTTQPTAVAMLNQCPDSHCTAQYFASAGSITVSDVSATSAAGTFDLTLVNADGESQGSLSGSFDAMPCP